MLGKEEFYFTSNFPVYVVEILLMFENVLTGFPPFVMERIPYIGMVGVYSFFSLFLF